MSIVTSKEMFRKAYDGGYAIGAFNVNNMEPVSYTHLDVYKRQTSGRAGSYPAVLVC